MEESVKRFIVNGTAALHERHRAVDAHHGGFAAFEMQIGSLHIEHLVKQFIQMARDRALSCS